MAAPRRTTRRTSATAPYVHPSTLGPRALTAALATERSARRSSRSRRIGKDSPEHAPQAAFVRWALDPATLAAYPEMDDLYAIPNWSGVGGQGRANAILGAQLNAEGRRKGMPDLHLPHARCGYHGLWLEFKSATGSISRDQRERIRRLRAAGHAVLVVYGHADLEAAKTATLSYLGDVFGWREWPDHRRDRRTVGA